MNSFGKPLFIRENEVVPLTKSDAFDEAVQRGEERATRSDEPFVPARDFYLSVREFDTRLAQGPRIDLASLEVYHLEEEHPVFRVPVTGA